jgi:homoserine O-acetyltransferase/O-succinyltransferase
MVPYGRGVTLPAGPQSRGHQTLRFAETWSDHLAGLLAQTETTTA